MSINESELAGRAREIRSEERLLGALDDRAIDVGHEEATEAGARRDADGPAGAKIRVQREPEIIVPRALDRAS